VATEFVVRGPTVPEHATTDPKTVDPTKFGRELNVRDKLAKVLKPAIEGVKEYEIYVELSAKEEDDVVGTLSAVVRESKVLREENKEFHQKMASQNKELQSVLHQDLVSVLTITTQSSSHASSERRRAGQEEIAERDESCAITGEKPENSPWLPAYALVQWQRRSESPRTRSTQSKRKQPTTSTIGVSIPMETWKFCSSTFMRRLSSVPQALKFGWWMKAKEDPHAISLKRQEKKNSKYVMVVARFAMNRDFRSIGIAIAQIVVWVECLAVVLVGVGVAVVGVEAVLPLPHHALHHSLCT